MTEPTYTYKSSDYRAKKCKINPNSYTTKNHNQSKNEFSDKNVIFL